MNLKKFTFAMLGSVFFFMVGLWGSPIHSAEPLPKGATMPAFVLKGTASPQTKAYLGVNNEKQFSLSQLQGKLALVEFFDVF